MACDVRLLEAPFDPATEQAMFAAAHPQAGGVVSFLGQVRQDGQVEALELQHYAPLTLPGMEALGQAVLARWPVHLTVIDIIWGTFATTVAATAATWIALKFAG